MKTTAATSPSAPKSREALRVLVVDDDLFQLELNTDLLKGLGVTDIITASNGDLALQAIAKAGGASGFHLMLTDLHMPGMDGFQFMEAAARNGFKGALIIVSGQSTEVMRSASLVAQLRRFKLLGTLTKPVVQTQLSSMLSKLVG